MRSVYVCNVAGEGFQEVPILGPGEMIHNQSDPDPLTHDGPVYLSPIAPAFAPATLLFGPESVPVANAKQGEVPVLEVPDMEWE